jgi:hypothetical protein
MNSSVATSVITELNDVASAERQSNVDRTLRIVAGGYGKITAGMISRRQAWGVQTVLRYLNGLEGAGLIEHVGARRTVESAWRITSAGKEYLQNVTNGCWATTVKSQSPGSTERDHHGN